MLNRLVMNIHVCFSGLVPLHNACSYGHFEVTDLLLKVSHKLPHLIIDLTYSTVILGLQNYLCFIDTTQMEICGSPVV
jgi:hypothetical protein